VINHINVIQGAALRTFLIALSGLVSVAFAMPAVLVEAENDTVMKFIYVGSNSSSTAHPAVSVGGKALGLDVSSENVNGAKAVVGRVEGFSLPSTGLLKVGLTGSGDLGVIGKGETGVRGEGSPG
jgi:hypothetical protein